MVTRAGCLIVTTLCLAGCNVPEPPGSTGGVDVQPGPCGRGIVVASSGADYVSTNISLATFDGAPLSESFLSSGSVPAGASAALSGDVVLPLATPRSGKVVLIDRQNNTLTWVDPLTATVTAQLSVSDGSVSNPHDYLEIADDVAYVSRFAAGDLWKVDPRTAQKIGTVTFPEEGGWKPNPDRMVASEGQVILALQRFASDYKTAADGRLVGLESDAVVWTVDVAGLSNCGGMSVSPSGAKLALTCTGVFPSFNTTDAEQNQHSGVVVFELGQRPPVALRQFSLGTQLGQPVGWSVAFASETVVMGRAVGDLVTGRRDVAFSLDTESGEVRTLVDADPFALGDVRCTPGCGGMCLLADASIGALRRWKSGVEEQAPIKVDTLVGLPPRFLGGF